MSAKEDQVIIHQVKQFLRQTLLQVQLTPEQLEIYPRLIQLKEELRELQRAELDLRSAIASGEVNYNAISQNNVAGYI